MISCHWPRIRPVASTLPGSSWVARTLLSRSSLVFSASNIWPPWGSLAYESNYTPCRPGGATLQADFLWRLQSERPVRVVRPVASLVGEAGGPDLVDGPGADRVAASVRDGRVRDALRLSRAGGPDLEALGAHRGGGGQFEDLEVVHGGLLGAPCSRLQ